MKLFSHNAGQLLFEKAKSISAQHTSWRCLYMNFSAGAQQYSDGLRTHVVTGIIKELLGEDHGYIYLCEDGDVFILFQGQAQPVLNRVAGQFKGLGQERPMEGVEDLYSLFDLSKHWTAFFALCQGKAPAVPVKAASHAAPAPAPVKSLRDPDPVGFRAACRLRPARKRPLVLVVEDDPFTRRLACNTLKAEYDLVEAGGAADALEAYGRHAPDAVFLDIELPDASGHVVLSRLLAFDPQAFVVMLSANSIKENILAALEKGSQGFITKPFAKEKLVHYLRQCEARRRAQPQGASA